MKVTLFSKCSKFYVDFQNRIKFSENVDGVGYNCVWICCSSFCQLWQEYMWSAVNVLKNGPKISDPTKRHDTTHNIFDINETLAWDYCRADFSSVLNPLKPWFPKGVLKYELGDILVTTFFGINNLGYIKDMKAIFFWKCSKFYVDSQIGIKFPKNVDRSEHNCVGTASGSFSQLLQQYMWSLVNVLKSSPRISGHTERHDTQLNLFNINGTLA